MKTLKRAMLIMFAMMMLMSTAVFAADSPVKSSFNASLKKTSVVYNGKKQSPKVVVKNENGKTLKGNKDFKATYKTCKNAGTYTVTVKGLGKYAGYEEKLTYKITKKAQTVKVSKASYTVKANNVKKKAQSMKLKVTKKAGTVQYTTNNKNIKVKNGKIVVAKGTKKGTYKVTVTVKSTNYKTVTKHVKVTVK